MLKTRDDIGIGIADNIGAETTMSPGIMVVFRSSDLGMTITIGMPIVLLEGNLESNMHTTT